MAGGGGRSSSVIAWAVAEKVSWYCALFLMLLLISSCCDSDNDGGAETATAIGRHRLPAPRHQRPCDEIYVVGEGETLQTISDKCNDPFILEENPHILDFDDVYPGLVIKITTTTK